MYGKKSMAKKRSCYKMKAAPYGNNPMKKNFPDLTGDGKVTQADVLKGRGVKLDSPAKKRVRPPQPPKPGTVKGITKFAYDMKDITSHGNKQLGKLRGKVRDKIKDYFFTK